MELYQQMYEEIDAIGTPDEKAAACANKAAEHAKAFLDYVSYLKGADYAEKTTDELYTDWITKLGYKL